MSASSAVYCAKGSENHQHVYELICVKFDVKLCSISLLELHSHSGY